MRIEQIRDMIEKAVDDEAQTGRLAKVLRQVATRNGANPTQQEIGNAVNFVREYVEHVPYYVLQGMGAARRAGLGVEMEEMVSALESYWFESDDFIPDHLGMMGLMDDAYASLVLLQAISDYCRATLGQPLLEQNLTQANRAIREMIGEPAASNLDQRVGITIGQGMMQRMFLQFAASGGFSFGGGPDPVWGNSIDQVVDARLSAMRAP